MSQSQQTGFLFDGPAYVANETQSDSWRKALWKVNLAYQIDATDLAYATWSQGFRRGAVNALPPTEAAVYDIQWHNVQESAFLTPLALPGALNVGDAFSRGIETGLFGRFTEHLSAQIDYTYDQTKLTSLSPLAFVGLSVPPPAVGYALPGTPKSTAAAALQYGHVQVGGGELRFAVNAHYQSAQIPALSATVPTVAGYTMVGARVGSTWSHWQSTLYVDNLTNQLGINSYTDPSQWGKYYQALVSRPRTVGLTIGYSFK